MINLFIKILWQVSEIDDSARMIVSRLIFSEELELMSELL